MLRIRLLSGADFASIPVAELADVRALKQRLNRLHGLPTRFRQRLLLRGCPLDDSAKVDSPMDLDLILLTHSDSSPAQADELATAAATGSTSQAVCCPKPMIGT